MLIFVSQIEWWLAICAQRQNMQWNFFYAIRRGIEAGSWHDCGALTNAVSVVLLLIQCVTRRPWMHAFVTFLTGGLFLFFIVSSALELH